MLKTKFYEFLAAAVLTGVLGLMGCVSGGGDVTCVAPAVLTAGVCVTPPAPLAVLPGTASVVPGTPTVFTITGGVKNYSVFSDNSAVISFAGSAVSGNTFVVNAANVFVDTPVTLSVTDSANAKVDLTVTVKAPSSSPLAVSPASASGTVGQVLSFVVTGGTPGYAVTSNNPSIAGVSSASSAGGQYIFTATLAGVGSNTLTLTDSNKNIITIALTVTTAALYTSAPGALTIPVGGASTSYSIGGGSAPYTATSSNNGVATASVTGTALTISGVTAGAANIVVRDATGAASVTFAVTVGSGAATPLYTTAPTAITIAIGEAPSYSIGGGSAAYTATSSNNSVATASVSGTSLTITGIASGAANILVRDATGATSVTIAATVGSGAATPLYTTAPAAITIAVGEAPNYSIGGGSAPYTATSSNNGVAKASVSGTSLTISGIAAGAANIAVLDATGASKTIAVTVGSGAATPLYTSAPAAVTLLVGGFPASYTVGGGTAPYIASSSNTNVATASVSGTTLTISGVATGAANIAVLDATGASKTIAVTVGSGAPTPLYTSAPGAVTIVVGGTGSYTIAGGTAPYSVSSSNSAIASVNASSPTFTITGVAAGTANIVVRDATGGAPVTIVVTVVNSAGAALYTTAPLAITIGAIGGVQTYTIGGGTSPYSVTSDNTNIASVTGSSGTTLKITGVADGKANILVQDATGSTSVKIAVNVATAQGFTVIGSAPAWTISGNNDTILTNDCHPADPSPYSVYFINGGTPPYTVSSTSPLVGTILGAGTDTVSFPTPTGAKSVNLNTVTVASGGYFVVAWPNANNNCASGDALFKVLDATGLVPTVTPSFKVTFTPS